MTQAAFAGDVTNRFELNLKRVLQGTAPQYSQEFVLADAVPVHGRRFTEFSGDVSGRYIEALSAVSLHSGQKVPELERVVNAILPLQKPDGHWGDAFGTEGVKNSDMALLWGNGRLLVGLMAYYKLNPRPEVLRAAKKLGDFMIGVAPRLNDDAVQKSFSDDRVAVGYICWTQCLEGLTELARVTKEQKYLLLCQDIATRIRRHDAQHSHGFVTSLRALLDLHRLTGDAKYLSQAQQEWDGIVQSGNLLPHGALPEAFKPQIHRDEGCSEADWLRFNLDLWKLTGRPRYLENAELTLFNEFAFNQFKTGDFGHHTITANGAGSPSAQAWWCCTFHGLRAFPDVLNAAFHTKNEAVYFDLPIEGAIEVPGLMLRANSRFEKDGTIDITVKKANGQPHTIAIRNPQWASRVTVQVDGKALSGQSDRDYIAFTRAWQPYETITVRYELQTRVVRHPENKNLVGFFNGPWLLGAERERANAFFNEPNANNRLILPKIDGDKVKLDAVKDADAADFGVPYAQRSVKFVHAGYPMQASSVVLRPIAEQTGCGTSTMWQFWFAPQEVK